MSNFIASALTALDLPGAACAGQPTALFFGPGRVGREPRSARLFRESTAKAICGGCPARPACLEHAVTYPEPDGIWGGVTAAERRGRLQSTRHEQES